MDTRDWAVATRAAFARRSRRDLRSNTACQCRTRFSPVASSLSLAPRLGPIQKSISTQSVSPSDLRFRAGLLKQAEPDHRKLRCGRVSPKSEYLRPGCATHLRSVL